jgi:glycosyltransferase involved in cell wall biosynthesis
MPHYIGHGYGDRIDNRFVEEKQKELLSSEKIKFVHMAGYNHKRKMTNEIIKIFSKATKSNKKISLTVFSQIPFDNSIKKEFLGNDNINLIYGDLTSVEIIEAYQKSHYSIQLSSHEGLGLGFYESISSATPVITINIPPHNEPVIEGVTGLLIPCKPMDLYDNNDALIQGGIFDSDYMLKKLEKISLSETFALINETALFFNKNLTYDCLAEKLRSAFFN